VHQLLAAHRFGMLLLQTIGLTCSSGFPLPLPSCRHSAQLLQVSRQLGLFRLQLLGHLAGCRRSALLRPLTATGEHGLRLLASLNLVSWMCIAR
jgi:hypothetical protein